MQVNLVLFYISTPYPSIHIPLHSPSQYLDLVWLYPIELHDLGLIQLPSGVEMEHKVNAAVQVAQHTVAMAY